MASTSADLNGKWTVETGSSEVVVSAQMFGFFGVDSKLNVSSGSIEIAAGSLSINVEVDSSSVKSGISKRYEDLQSAGFLDVDAYPGITFEASQPWSGEPTSLSGTLSIKGKQIPVTMNVTGISGADSDSATVSAATHLDRNDVGLSKSPSFVINPGLDVAVNLRARRTS